MLCLVGLEPTALEVEAPRSNPDELQAHVLDTSYTCYLPNLPQDFKRLNSVSVLTSRTSSGDIIPAYLIASFSVATGTTAVPSEPSKNVSSCVARLYEALVYLKVFNSD